MRNNYYYGVREGWDSLVKPLIQFVVAHDGRVLQVKEKFGGLRFYYAQPMDADEELWERFEEIVQAAENLSTITCEYTGNYGEIRNLNGWLKCLSDEEYEKIMSKNGNNKNFKEHVRYNNQEWVVTGGFLSGNGTQDIQMIHIKNIKTEEEMTVAEVDVAYISPF